MTGIPLPTIGSCRLSRRSLVVCLVALMTVLAGCGGMGGNGDGAGGETTAADGTTAAGGDTGTGTDETSTPDGGANVTGEGNASLRVAHMSPDAPDVDVSIDGQPVLSGVAFGDVSEYLTVPAGQHRVRVTEAGNESNVVYEDTVTLGDGAYTLSAVGEVSEDTRTQFDVVLFEDETGPAGNNSSIRLAHVSPDAGPVDVTVNDTDEVLFDNATFGNATEYAQVPAGEYTLDVRRATPGNDGRIVSSFNVSAPGGTAQTVFAAGYVQPGRAPVGVLFEPVTVTDGPNATVRFAHVSPDAPDVDVYVNGQLATGGLPFGAQTEYFEVPAGNRTVSIVPENGSEPVFEGQVTLEESTNYTVAAAGEATDGADRPFEPIVLNDDLETPDDQAKLRLVHAAPDAPAVDVEVPETGNVVFDDVAYGNASNYTTVPPGNYTFDVFVATPDDSGDDIASFENNEVSAGSTYTVFAVGYVTTGDEPGDREFDLVVANDTDDYVDRDTLS